MLYNWETSSRLSCSQKEMEECYPLVRKIISLSEKGRRQGLLSLEQDIDDLEPLFFQRALQLVVDGTDPELIRHVLEIEIFARGYSGKKLLEVCIIYEGVLAIQEGDNPRIIEEILHSFFPEEFQLQRGKRVSEKYHIYLTEMAKDTSRSALSDFETVLLGIDDKGVQKILREIDRYSLGIAMAHLANPVKYKILKNMSEAAGIQLLEDMDFIGTVTETHSKEEQDKIYNIIAKLEDQGEIIAGR